MNHDERLPALAGLTPERQTEVLDALAAVETSRTPVPLTRFQALLDPGLCGCVAQCLDEKGRILIRTERGYTSGYADDVTDALVKEGSGVLPDEERAVLALVLLHCVAIPRAEGRIQGTEWTDAEPVRRNVLEESSIGDGIVRDSLPRLKARGLVCFTGQGGGMVLPGPQFARLTEAASRRLWDQLVLVAAPDGALARIIRRDHQHGLANSPSVSSSVPRPYPGASSTLPDTDTHADPDEDTP